jgi:hypothetical protein
VLKKNLGKKQKKRGFRPVAGGGAATGKCNRRWRYAGRDEDSSLFLKYQEPMRKERENRERESKGKREKFF